MFLFHVVNFKPLTYNTVYTYPWWGETIGWGLALSSMLCIPLTVIYKLLRSDGSFREVRMIFSLLTGLGLGSAVYYHLLRAHKQMETSVHRIQKSHRLHEIVFLCVAVEETNHPSLGQASPRILHTRD